METIQRRQERQGKREGARVKDTNHGGSRVTAIARSVTRQRLPKKARSGLKFQSGLYINEGKKIGGKKRDHIEIERKKGEIYEGEVHLAS